MPTLRLLLFSALALQLLVAEAGVAQASACLTNADTASMHVKNVTRIVTASDSALLVQQGIPYRPGGGVSLVTDTLTCRSIVNAYNALDWTPSTNISRAYVVKVGTTAYAMAEGAPPFAYYFWDTAYRCLAALAAM